MYPVSEILMPGSTRGVAPLYRYRLHQGIQRLFGGSFVEDMQGVIAGGYVRNLKLARNTR